jgi:hypothetical protein
VVKDLPQHLQNHTWLAPGRQHRIDNAGFDLPSRFHARS